VDCPQVTVSSPDFKQVMATAPKKMSGLFVEINLLNFIP
jgi:hypothetical protein